MNYWFWRQIYLIDFTALVFMRQWQRFLGLLAVYSLLVFILLAVFLFTGALRKEAALILENAPEIVLQHLKAGRHDLIPPEYLDKIGVIRGVQKVEPRLWGYHYDAVVKANYTFMVPPSTANIQNLANNEIVIGSALARLRGLQIGNLISWRGYSGELFTFKVVQILSPESELMSADLVLISAQSFRNFFDYPENYYTDITLSIANPREVRNVALKLAEIFPAGRPILREEILRTYSALFDWRGGLVLAILTTSILAFAILAWNKASGISVDENREIGILKAIGWSAGDIILMKFWEALIISFLAFLIGFIGAFVYVFILGGGIFRSVLQGWAVLYPEFTLPIYIDGGQILTLLILLTVPYISAILVPIWKSAVSDPDAVIRI